jgi:hypothetical protein
LTGLFGSGTNLAAYSLGATVSGSSISGATSGTVVTERHELMDLGNGRILSIFASFQGSPSSETPANPGIYA